MEAKHWEEMRQAQVAGETRSSGLGELFGRLSDEVSRLIRLEIQLARTELSEKAAVLGKNAGSVAGGAMVALVGLTILGIAIGFLLGTVMPVWLGFLLTAVVFIGLGGAVAANGIKTIRNTPMQLERTSRTIEEDKQWMKHEAEDVKRDPAHLGQR